MWCAALAGRIYLSARDDNSPEDRPSYGDSRTGRLSRGVNDAVRVTARSVATCGDMPDCVMQSQEMGLLRM